MRPIVCIDNPLPPCMKLHLVSIPTCTVPLNSSWWGGWGGRGGSGRRGGGLPSHSGGRLPWWPWACGELLKRSWSGNRGCGDRVIRPSLRWSPMRGGGEVRKRSSFLWSASNGCGESLNCSSLWRSINGGSWCECSYLDDRQYEAWINWLTPSLAQYHQIP